MDHDPGQRVGVSKKFPAVARELKRTVENFRNEVLPELGKDERPFVIGHPEVTWTQVPARDGVPHGGIKRSNKFPNCSYFTNWTKEDDYLSWEVEVGKEGTYEVELWYACPKKDLGSVVELSFLGQSLRAKITDAHDPPLRGMREDRSPRSESYVKDFKPMKMGQMKFAAGKGEMKLRAIKIPSGQALEFRLFMLRRI